MIVVYGGRGQDGSALNDAWGLRRHTEGNWDWIKAPYQGEPSARYQHSVLFIGSIMLVIGGRANAVNETLSLEAYDTVTSNWFKFTSPQRFRSGSWLVDTNLFIYGGFELSTPNIPTDSMIKINLMNLFSTKPTLRDKIAPFEVKPPDSPPPSKPSTPTVFGDTGRNSAIISKGGNQSPKPSIVENPKGYKDTLDPKKGLNSREDIPLLFLNVLCQPEMYQNTDSIKFIFKPSQILALIEMVKEAVIEQPILIKGNFIFI